MSVYFTVLVNNGASTTRVVEAEPLDRMVHLGEENASSFVGFSSTTTFRPAAVGPVGNNVSNFVLPANMELWALGTDGSSSLRIMVTSTGR